MIGNHYEWDHMSTPSDVRVLLVVITCLVIYPWLTIKKVDINISYPTKDRHIILVEFPDYVTPGQFGRVSRGGLWEWHAFAVNRS